MQAASSTKAAPAFDKHAPYATGPFVITETLLLGPSRRWPFPTHPAASHIRHDSIKMEHDDRTDSELAHDHGEEVVG
jgi:hypothetical protein